MSAPDRNGEGSEAATVGMETPPLAVDVDGTLTDDEQAVDPGVFPILREWEAPVVVATGKAAPFPVGLCEFVGIEPRVVAENGGIVVVADADVYEVAGDRAAVDRVVSAYRDLGHDLGWGSLDLANRWRETEIAISLDRPRQPLDELAAEEGLVVLDTGFAYHLKDPTVDKGTGLARVAAELGREPADFLAVGDSENDVPTFERAGEAVAVANADDRARAAADRVTEASHADGFREAVAPYR